MTSSEASNVVRFPSREPEVIEGEVVPSRPLVTLPRRVVTHPRTKAAGRHAAFAVGGFGLLASRIWEASTNSVWNRQIRNAEAKGDIETLEKLLSGSEKAKKRRHERTMDLVRLPFELLRTGLLLTVAWLGFLFFIGCAWAYGSGDSSRIMAPVQGFLTLITWACWAVAAAWLPLLLAVPWVFAVACWHVGRKADAAPRWLAPVDVTATVREVIPDEGAILGALRNLSLPPLDRKFKEGWQPRWTMPTTRDGKGYRTQLELPQGVTVKMIAERREVLAHNLVRLPVETWPTEPQSLPGVLDMWVADQGLLTGPIPSYPLLADGTCDYFKGVPVGVDQRGDVVTAKLMASNYAIGGMMGSGKSSLVLDLCAGSALDELVDIDAYVMAYNADYDPLKPRLRLLVKGDEDEHITAAMDGLRDLREEVTSRGKLLTEMGGEETKLTRAVAKRDARMRPRLVVFDECQELFRHEKYGPQAKELAIKVMTKARKCGITLVWVTPEPSADSLPRELAKVVSHRVCFAIGDHQGNDAILGTGAYKRGISAVDLMAEENIGTAMASGFGSRPGLLRTFYIRKDKQVDQMTPIVRRSLEPWRGARSTAPDEERDLVTDVADVLGTEDVTRARDVVARLRQFAPGYEPYAALNGAKLVQMLRAGGVRVTLKDGYEVVHRDRIYQAIDARETVALDAGH